MDLKKGNHMIKQKLSSSLFDCKELTEYNGNQNAFVNEKAGNSTLDRSLRRWIARRTCKQKCGALFHLDQSRHSQGVKGCLDPEDGDHHVRGFRIFLNPWWAEGRFDTQALGNEAKEVSSTSAR